MASNPERNSRRKLSFGSTPSEPRKCGLCHDHRATVKLSSPSQWKNQNAITYVHSLNVSVAFVCQACRQDITKVLSSDSFVPRWQKVEEKANKTCSVKNCTDKVFASLHKATETDIEKAFDTCNLQSLDPIPTPTPLCKHHYHTVYNLMHPTQTHCVMCGLSLRHTTPKLCTQTQIIELHLKENTGFEGAIKEGDKVCYVCYRSHLIILEKRGQELYSTDSDLQQIIQQTQKGIQTPITLTSDDELIQICMKRAIVTVGNELLQRNVLLLQTVHDIFCRYVNEMAQGLKINKVVSSAWILSNLTVALGKHITYTCSTRKFGTIIYRSNSDLVPALSHALWKIRNMPKDQESGTDIGIETTSQSLDVLDKLNEKAHSRIKTLLAQCTEHPYEHDKINIDKMIEDTDPILWEAVCKLTRSQNERRGRVYT